MPNRNAIRLLEQDHKKVRKLLGELAQTTDRAEKRRQELLEEIADEIELHARIEEELFYPAFKEAVSAKQDLAHYFEALEEHHVVDLVLPELQDCDLRSPEFAAKAKVLKDLVEHHAEEEESQMFPRAREVMDEETLEELGNQIAERKLQLAR